jgi:hypothetical protein
METWWRKGVLLGNLGPIAGHVQGASPIDSTTILTCYGAGGLATAALSIARLAFTWWPIHPIGLLVCATYPIYKIWFSFFVGWFIKVLVMRYGGLSLYKRMKPAAMGLIAAEAVVAGLFLLISLLAAFVGFQLPA